MKELERLLERVPNSIPLWDHLGRGDPQSAIAEASYEAIRPGLPLKDISGRSAALAWVVYWLMRYGHGPRSRNQRVDSLSLLPGFVEAWSLAEHHKSVKDLLSQVEFGVRGYEHKDGVIRLPYNGHPGLALLEKYLTLKAGVDLNLSLNPYVDAIAEYAESAEATKDWFRSPSHIRDLVRKATGHAKSQIRPYLNPTLSTPIGVALGDLEKFWNEISAISLYDYWIMQATSSPSRTVYSRKKFVADMAKAVDISRQSADEITKRLTLSKDYASAPDSAAVHNPQLTPIVEFEGGLFLVAPLLIPSLPSHETMKMLQVAYSGHRFHQLGHDLGKAGEEQVAALLKEKLRGDIRVATNVLTYMGRRQCPDLDVVVYAHGEVLIVIQVRWHILVNNQHEALLQQKNARKDRQDLEALRDKINAGTVQVRWPSEWDNVDADRCERRWFVLNHDTMPVHDLGDSDIKMRSYLLIKHLLPGEEHSAHDLLKLLDCPPTPTAGEPSWDTIRYGDVKIEEEHPNFHPDQPAPFKDISEIVHLVLDPATRYEKRQ